MSAQEGNGGSGFQERFDLLIACGQASELSVQATRVAIGMVEKHYGITLDEALGAFLANHLAVTLKRLMAHEELAKLPESAWAELADFPEECALAKEIAAAIEKRIGMSLSMDEAGFIAVHLYRIKIEAGAGQAASE
jgi:transcriptional regulatory protein LevR